MILMAAVAINSNRDGDGGGGGSDDNNPHTTQTLEYTKDKYNAKIIK
jgi:hypothetical protein